MRKCFTNTLVMGLTLSLVAFSASAQAGKKMKGPETVTITGKLVDMSCAAKGEVMMGSDANALNNTHMTPNGKIELCATKCLQGGQPAGIYNNGKLTAALLANASLNLYKFAAKDVEVQGFWAGKKADNVKTFMPAKIRIKGTKEWTDVMAAEMH